VILFTSKHGLKSRPNITVTVGEKHQIQSSSVHDLGDIYNRHLSMSQHVHSVCRTGYYHLMKIGRKRRCITIDAMKTLVHVLVTRNCTACPRIILRICNVYRMLARVSSQQPVAAHISRLF